MVCCLFIKEDVSTRLQEYHNSGYIEKLKKTWLSGFQRCTSDMKNDRDTKIQLTFDNISGEYLVTGYKRFCNDSFNFYVIGFVLKFVASVNLIVLAMEIADIRFAYS